MSDKSNLDFVLHAGELVGVRWDCRITGDGNHSKCEGSRAISVAGLKTGYFFIVFFFLLSFNENELELNS